MPKDKAPSKPKSQKAKTPKPKTKRKSLTKSKSKDGNSIASLFKLPNAMELKRGPLLRVNFPKVDENEDDDDPIEVPQDPHELKRLYKPFPKLQVFDPETGEDSFGGPIQVLDYIQIRAGEVGGQSVEDTEQWFGQILYIGARKISKGKDREDKEIMETDVCLRVAWFYDYDMLGQRPITPEDKKSCSNMIKHELIFSDHHDTIHLSSVQGLIDIAYFDEMRSSIEPFQYGDRFYRRVLFGDRIISPKPTCTTRCKLTYHPERDIQHYCPRVSCKRWYHTTCLVPTKTRVEDYRILEYEQPPSEDRQIMELMTVLAPESDAPGVLKPIKDKDKFGDVGASSETETETTLESPVPPSGAAQRRLALARQLPSPLQALVTSAITRGIKSGQGITGGGWVVGYARTLARKVVFEGGVLTEQEETELYEAAKSHNASEEFKITPLSYFCPGCAHPI